MIALESEIAEDAIFLRCHSIRLRETFETCSIRNRMGQRTPEICIQN